MQLNTLARYVLGRRDAILEIAADRRALAVGFLLVFSAALAREYDTADLTKEPLRLLLPWGMSLAASFLLWSVVYLALLRSKPRPPFLDGYRAFLTLFWMTAPLAWLYGVPYERFLSPYDATLANLWTLALVAAFRVILTVRVVQVLAGFSGLASTVLVATAADAVALVVTSFSPKPILSIMGGIAHEPRDELLVDLTIKIFISGFYGLVFLALPFLGFLFLAKSKRSPGPEPKAGGRGTWFLTALAILFWAIWLPWTQGEQQRASAVDDLLAAGKVHEGLVLLSATDPGAFPPHFTPRPRQWIGELEPPLLDVVDALGEEPAPPWVERLYLEKVRTRLRFYQVDVESLEQARADPDVRACLERSEHMLRQLDETI